MKSKFIHIFLLTTAVVLSFQNCGVGGEGVGNLGSQSTSGSTTGGGDPDPLPPTLDLDMASLLLAPNQVSFSLSGDCDTRAQSSYAFDLTYTPNGGAPNTRRITGVCSANRFSFAVTKSDLGMAAPTPGTLAVKITLFLATGDLSGNAANAAITWKSLTAHASVCEFAPPYISGDTNSLSGSCTPPAGTVETRLNYVLDDYGTILVNGARVVDYPFECKVQTGEIAVNMTVGVVNTVQFNAINCGLGGVGGRATFTFMGYW